jgi:hypothetical protein
MLVQGRPQDLLGLASVQNLFVGPGDFRAAA